MASVLSTPPETPPALGFMRPLLSWPKPVAALGWGGCGCGCGAGAGVGCTLAEAACALRTSVLFFAVFNAAAACVFSAGDKAASWALVSALAMAACNAALALLMAWLAAAASVAEILPSLSVSWLRVKAACTACALVAISAMALSAAVLAALGVDGTVGRDWVLGCPPPPPPQAVSARLHAMAKAFKVKFPVFIVFSCGWLLGGKSVSNQWVQAAFHDDGITLRAFRTSTKSSLH